MFSWVIEHSATSLVYVSTTFSNKSSHIEQIEPNTSNPIYFLTLMSNELLKTIKL